MDIDYEKLWKSEWDTTFEIETKSKEEIVILISVLKIEDITYKNIRLNCLDISNEWAMLWNETIKKWVDHPEIDSPIGNRITAFNAKPIGKYTKFSLGGTHNLGWARWGFTSKSYEFKSQ